MNDHGQQARASENFAGPVDFETPRPDLPVHFLNFQKPCLTTDFTGPGLLAVVFHKPWAECIAKQAGRRRLTRQYVWLTETMSDKTYLHVVTEQKKSVVLQVIYTSRWSYWTALLY